MPLIRGNKGGLIMNSYSSATACVPKMLLLIEIILRRVQSRARIIILASNSLSCSAFFLAAVESAYIYSREAREICKYSAQYPWDTRWYILRRLDYFGPFFSRPVSLATASRHERHLTTVTANSYSLPLSLVCLLRRFQVMGIVDVTSTAGGSL